MALISLPLVPGALAGRLRPQPESLDAVSIPIRNRWQLQSVDDNLFHQLSNRCHQLSVAFTMGWVSRREGKVRLCTQYRDKNRKYRHEEVGRRATATYGHDHGGITDDSEDSKQGRDCPSVETVSYSSRERVMKELMARWRGMGSDWEGK